MYVRRHAAAVGRQVAVEDVQVGAAHAAGAHAQQNLAGARPRNRLVHRLQPMAPQVHGHCQHDGPVAPGCSRTALSIRGAKQAVPSSQRSDAKQYSPAGVGGTQIDSAAS